MSFGDAGATEGTEAARGFGNDEDLLGSQADADAEVIFAKAAVVLAVRGAQAIFLKRGLMVAVMVLASTGTGTGCGGTGCFTSA